MTNTYNIPVVTRLQDDQDGGYTMYVYNNKEELIEDHPLNTTFDPKTRKYVKGGISEEQKKAILSEEDSFQNGSIGKYNISVTVDDDGIARLDDRLTFPIPSSFWDQ